MNKLVTLSSEWKTSELRQVMMALASGPEGVSGGTFGVECASIADCARDCAGVKSHTHCEEVAAYEQLGGRGEDPYPEQVKHIDKVAQTVARQLVR